MSNLDGRIFAIKDFSIVTPPAIKLNNFVYVWLAAAFPDRAVEPGLFEMHSRVVFEDGDELLPIRSSVGADRSWLQYTAVFEMDGNASTVLEGSIVVIRHPNFGWSVEIPFA